MKKFNPSLVAIGLTLAVAVGLASCQKDSDTDDTWKIANEQAFNAIVQNSEYTELKSPGNNGSIYYKVLQQGDGVKPIYYTSRVQVYYKGWFVAVNPDKRITPGTVFSQQLFDDGAPSTLAVSSAGVSYDSYGNILVGSVITGWEIALQHMVEGDKWEIWIPYQFAYGESGSSSIPGYSALAFEIEVMNVIGVDEF